MNTCQICNSELTNIKQTFRARMRDKNNKPSGNRYRYQAWCSKCSIFLTKNVSGKKVGRWVTSHVTVDNLDKELTEKELIALSKEIQKKENEDPIFRKKEKWDTFISMKKTTDKLYKYIRKDNTNTVYGLVIKRDSFLIGFYVLDTNSNLD